MSPFGGAVALTLLAVGSVAAQSQTPAEITLRPDLSLVPNRRGFAPTDLSVVDGCSNFSFSPDGSWYAFQCIQVHSDLYVIDALE